MTQDRVRIVAFEPEKQLTDIVVNPSNWRVHSEQQSDYMKSVLQRVGWIDAVIVNKRNGHIIDGHLRYELATQSGATTVPAVIVDLTADEELLALSTFDAIGSMADTNGDILGDLLNDVRGSFDSDIDALLSGISDMFLGVTIDDGLADTASFAEADERSRVVHEREDNSTLYKSIIIQVPVDQYAQVAKALKDIAVHKGMKTASEVIMYLIESHNVPG